jgi:ATP-dependent helicase/nuclease subunit B
MAASPPHVFTIPASVPFLPALIKALLDGRLVEGFPNASDPLSLAEATLYLPTRRACRLARDVFLDVLGQDAAILPRIAAIGDIDEDEIVFAESAAGGLAAQALDLPPALGGIARKTLLAQLILKWAAGIAPDKSAPLVANSPASAFALADQLARLIDDMITRKVSWDRLDELVPDEHDKYWDLTLDFLKIARQHWPAILAEHGAMEAAERRDRLIEAETKRLQAGTGPVIAAGSTGSMPSTAMLLETIARLPRGAVVLPGLDTDLDEPSWQMILKDRNGHEAVNHPQFGLAALLSRIGIARADVTMIATPALHGREAFLSEALRPAATTDLWKKRLSDKTFPARRDTALWSMSVVEAAHAEDEALAIAIALREAIDDGTPQSRDRRAALITPDRALARRVLAALERWNVPVDDSGGDALSDSPAGIFARYAVEVALGGVEPVPLLALVKHSLCRLGQEDRARLGAVASLERAIFRGPRPRAGSAGLAHALQTLRDKKGELHRNDPRAGLSEAVLDQAAALVAQLSTHLAPLEALPSKPLSLRELAVRHRDVVARLSADSTGAPAAFSGLDGAALSSLFEQMIEESAAATFMVGLSDYPELFDTIAAGQVVRRPGAPGARVRIYGPLEARLQQADRVVLGGLVEGTWPPETQSDPWLSRPMRRDLGLDLPERRIGLSAHDFAQALGAPDIVLTRAAKVAGAPTVPSRFLQRLAAVAGEAPWKEAVKRGEKYLDWARALDRPVGEPKPCERPAPTPPVETRPKRLTVTEIEHWLRDPYTIYAKHILKIAALDPVDTPPGARDRGTIIHAAIGNFTEQYAAALPADPVAALTALGQDAFKPLDDYPEARAFWWPRFLRIARWFAGWETGRRAAATAIFAEMKGEIEVAPGFKLGARADRIERLSDGRYAVLDYKTGQPPGDREVKIGLAPQLTLEGAMIREGGFEGIPAGASIAELLYLRLNGGDPAGQPAPKQFKDSTPDQEADKALARLRGVVAEFALPETPYRSFTRPQWVGRTYSDYDHLARVKEWSAFGGEDDGVPE